MKNLTPSPRRRFLNSYFLILTLLPGCQAGVSVSGTFATPQQTVSGTVQTTTNGVTLGGDFQAGTTNIGGTITVGK